MIGSVTVSLALVCVLTSDQPIKVVRVLDDGSTQLAQVRYTNAVMATSAVSYTYDTNYARLLTMTDGIGTTAYSYHTVTNTQLGAGQLASVDGPLANDTVTYEYDALGRVKRRATDGVAQAVAYHALGRVTVVTNALGAFTNEYAGVTARIATNHFPNGQQTTLTYYGTNDDLRLEEIRHTSTNAQLSAFGYTYDPAGQIVAWTQEPGTGNTNIWVTEYDPVDQLLGVTVRSNTVAGVILQRYVYGYDSAGNRTSEQIDTGGDPLTSAVTAASHNNLNQLTAVTGGGPVRFAGSLDELGTVTVDGNEAPLDSRTTNFVGSAELDSGTNVVAVVASDYSDNRRTNQYRSGYHQQRRGEDPGLRRQWEPHQRGHRHDHQPLRMGRRRPADPHHSTLDSSALSTRDRVRLRRPGPPSLSGGV